MVDDIGQFDGQSLKLIHKPILLRLKNSEDKAYFNELQSGGKISFVHDEIYGQLQELIKSKNPSIRIKAAEYESRISSHLQGIDITEYGVWAYYPWSQRLVHLLDEDEFVEVRTNRNQYKITKAERELLGTKRIGIVGLSVGQSIALTLAMERSFGELRLADFDELELSNLNRIRTGIHNLGVPKVIIAAREIAEIDPFLNVTCFFDGLTEENLDEFFLENGKLDILVDECDGLDIKILSRFKARELGIPVLMDTSDRGMVDVERFDLEPDRSILHGTVEKVNPENIKGLSNEEKIPVVLQMLGVENVSLRAKASMVEVEQSINTWPQLASSVALGGAAGADICRRILLDQFHESGRYYIDLEELIADKNVAPQVALARTNPFSPLNPVEMERIGAAVQIESDGSLSPGRETIERLVSAACAAPSTGNDQPWKWLYKKNVLHLFHDEFRSFSFGDYQNIASFITFGAAYENLYLQALEEGIEPYYEFLPGNKNLVASIKFRPLKDRNTDLASLQAAIFRRHTNRNSSIRTELPQTAFDQLTGYAESISGAKVKWFRERSEIEALGKIIGACDRMRLLNPEGHYDFVHHEMRWTSEQAERTLDGIDVKTLGLSNAQLAALSVIKDEKVVGKLRELEGGYAFDMLAKRTVESASGICLITLPKYQLSSFFEGGRAMERLWLAATNLDLAVHPLISPLYFFPRIIHGSGEGLDQKNIEELNLLRKQFVNLTQVEDGVAEVFLAKVAVASEPVLKSHRLPTEQVLFFQD